MKPSKRNQNNLLQWWILPAAFILIGLQGQAQEVLVRLNLPPIDRFTAKDLYNAQLINLSGKDLQVFLVGTVSEETRGLLFDGTSAVFTLKAGFNGLPAFSQLEPVKITYKNKQVESYVWRTGTVPPGTYSICIRVMDASTHREVGEDCIQTELLSPMPPELILPENESQVDQVLPIFSWTPPAPMSLKVTMVFVFRMVELLSHQTVDQALASNPSWYSSNTITGTTFQYPGNARPLEIGKKFAWQVMAISESGEQLAPPSPPFWFQMADESQPEPPTGVIIVSGPHKKGRLEPIEDLVFSWKVSGHLREPATYLFHVYQYDLSGSPENFGKDNLVYSKGDIRETQLIIPRSEASWDPEKGYVWLVYLLTKEHYYLQDSIFPIPIFDKRFDFGDVPDDGTGSAGYHTLFHHDGARCYWMTKGMLDLDPERLPNPDPENITLYRSTFAPTCLYDRYIPESQQAWLGTIENRYLCDEIKPDLESDSRYLSAGEDNFDDGIFFSPTVSYCEPCQQYSLDVEVSIHPEYTRSNKLMFSGWVDWNADGDWDDGYEGCTGKDKLFWTRVEPLYNTGTAPVLSGNVALVNPETWGGDTTCAGYRFYFDSGIAPDITADRPARFRLTPAFDGIPQSNSTSYQGEVTSGEVEDYIIRCRNYGDRLKVLSPSEIPLLRTSISDEPHSVRSCEGEWTRNIVSGTDFLVDRDDNRLCTHSDPHAVLVDRPGCPLTPEGAAWIGENSSGISSMPHGFLHCFHQDGCVQDACMEIISPAIFTIFLNGHIVGTHTSGCGSLSSFSIPKTYFNPDGDNQLLFSYSTGVSASYHGFAFALHIRHEEGAYETNLPGIAVVNPVTTGPLYLCDMTGLICRAAPCLSYPLSPDESIQLRITDESRIESVQVVLSYQSAPSATTDCRHFAPGSSGSSGLLEEGTHFTVTAISEREWLVTIPVPILTGLFPGLSGDCRVDVTCIIRDGACIQNTLQTSVAIKLGCE